MSQARVLVVDDEASILDLVSAYLRNAGYQVSTAEDGPTALKAIRALKPDIVVLDVMLPGMDGLDVLSRVRRESDVYIIMLTAKSEETDKIVGLSVGADDYMTKPFSPRELVARIKAALRRLQTGSAEPDGGVLVSQRLRVDTGRRQVWCDDAPITLTSIEFDLLKTLVEYRGLVLTRDQLLEKVWGYDFYGDDRVVDVHIGHIRQKLGDPALIATVRGVGYRFEDEAL